MKLRHAPAGHDTSHGIDLAPMLDFVINLLIFFIITAVFVKESGNIERVKAVRDHPAVVILADAGAPTGAVVEVADQVRLGGIYDVTFVVSTAPPVKAESLVF